MIKLILRQIGKYRWPVLGLLLVWGVGGYWIYNNRYEMVAWLSAVSTDYPGPGQQDSSHAYFQYVQPAMEAVEEEGIRLDLMKKSCPARSKQPFFDINLGKHHWLEKIQTWNVAAPGDSPEVIEPSSYWKKHKETVLNALQELIRATYYAYEVSGEDRGHPGKEIILIPALIADYSEALCMPLMGRLAWGDYVEFQEERAYLQLEENEPEAFRYRLPAERDLLTLGTLKNSRNYQEALLQYLGGGAPSPFSPEGCRVRSLVCLAPREAFQVYNKLIFAAPSERLPYLFLEQGQVLGWMARQGDDLFTDPYERSLDFMTGASENRALEREARSEMARIYIATDRYEEARDEIRQLALSSNLNAPEARDLRELARKALSGMGQHKEADCFSESVGLPRPHCDRRMEYLR